MLAYVRLFYIQVRASFVFSLQYRADFVLDGVVELVWGAAAVVPLVVVAGNGRAVGGFTYPEALVVLGWFTIVKALLDGAVGPSITTVVEHVRKGTLDFVLLKPKDTQFLVSTARFYPWRSINVVLGVLLFVWAFRLMGRAPSARDVALSLVLLADAIAVLYALLVLTVSVAFYAVKVDNLTFLLGAIFDAARWPGGVFRGGLRVLFTFVIPLVVMTTFPAEALLGKLSFANAALTTLGAAAFLVIARALWLRAVRSYTSASS